MPRKHASYTAHTNSPLKQPAPLTFPELLKSLFDEHGRVAVDRVAEAFGISITQLALTVGLSRDSLYKTKRAEAGKTQTRLREMLEIITRVVPWAGGQQQAMAWYRAQPIPAFGDRTAEALLKEGKASTVRDYLDFLALGNFA